MKEDTILLYFAVQSEKNTRYPPSLLNPIITLEQEAQISEDREGGSGRRISSDPPSYTKEERRIGGSGRRISSHPSSYTKEDKRIGGSEDREGGSEDWKIRGKPRIW